MSTMLRTIGVLAALILAVVACTGPGATTAPTGTAAPTASPTMAPTASPTSAASPTTAPSPTDGASPSPTGAATPSPSPSPTPPPGAEEGTLTIWADNVRAPVFTAVAEAFTTEYGVPVQVYQIGFGDIRDQLILRGPAGEGPDLIVGAHDWLGQLVDAGVVEPLEIPADKAANFQEVGLRAMSYDGTLYGMPTGSEAIALYYNKDLMPDGNPPETWDELKQIAAELQEAGTVEQGYCLMRADPYHSYPILTGFGGYIFGENADGSYNPEDVGLDSEGGLAYANELDSMVKEGLLRDNVDYGACVAMMTGDAGANAPRAAFFITGPWELPNFRDSGINFGVAPIPTMEDTAAPFVGVQGMFVSAFAPNKLLAQTFLTEFMATDEAMGDLYEADPRLPVWIPLAETITDADTLAFTESAAAGNPMPAIPQMSSVWTAWTDAINLIFAQTEDPETAVENAAEQIRTLIGE